MEHEVGVRHGALCDKRVTVLGAGLVHGDRPHPRDHEEIVLRGYPNETAAPAPDDRRSLHRRPLIRCEASDESARPRGQVRAFQVMGKIRSDEASVVLPCPYTIRARAPPPRALSRCASVVARLTRVRCADRARDQEARAIRTGRVWNFANPASAPGNARRFRAR